MDDGSKPETPSISTEDFTSTPVINVDDHEQLVPPTLSTSSISHSRCHSGPPSLSPGPPRSPTRMMDTAIDEDGLSAIPPAHTLSTLSSVHFKSSTALRDNEPADGSVSICPRDPSHSHRRRSSTATMTSTDDATVVDRLPVISHLYPATSNITVSTRSAVETLDSLTPSPTSDVGNHEGWMRDHREPGRKVGSDTQGRAEAEGDARGIVKALDDPSLFSGGHFGSPSPILKNRESRISKGDRIAL